jgi:hypothetical protein
MGEEHLRSCLIPVFVEFERAVVGVVRDVALMKVHGP